jgi:acylphosphatase
VLGGVTALGGEKDYPVYLDESALGLPAISASAGVRGTQILLAPEDYVRATRATLAAISKGGEGASGRHTAMVVSPGGGGVAAYRFRVQGRVQGVGYRYFVLRQAEELGVAGYARNREDGTVEVVAEASEETLRDFETRLREGPAFASVEGLERAAIAPRGDQGFHIR